MIENVDRPKIEAVLFDYGMVLSGPPDVDAREEMERILGVDGPTFQAAYWRHRDAYDRGALGGVAYWETVAHDLQRILSAEELDGLIRADNKLWTQPNIPMMKWAAALQSAGIKTGILSNLGDAMESGIFARFPRLDAFAHRTFSHRLGIAKPDPAIYRHAAEGLAVPVNEILFIDDKEENIEAARTAGMTAIQYTGHDAFVQAMKDLRLERMLSPVTTSQASLA